jgi:hypothetical protein
MNVPKFNEREKALEDEYIRKKEYALPPFRRPLGLLFVAPRFVSEHLQ